MFNKNDDFNISNRFVKKWYASSITRHQDAALSRIYSYITGAQLNKQMFGGVTRLSIVRLIKVSAPSRFVHPDAFERHHPMVHGALQSSCLICILFYILF